MGLPAEGNTCQSIGSSTYRRVMRHPHNCRLCPHGGSFYIYDNSYVGRGRRSRPSGTLAASWLSATALRLFSVALPSVAPPAKILVRCYGNLTPSG